jgi:hypothetical protein
MKQTPFESESNEPKNPVEWFHIIEGYYIFQRELLNKFV